MLGIRPDAPDWEIPVAYRRRAADLASRRVSNRETLRELNAAYEALRYPDLRREYDQQRAAALQRTGDVVQPVVRPPSAYPRFRHPRATRSSRAATYGALLGVVAVMAVALVAGTFFMERVAGGIAPLTSLARMAGLSSVSRPPTSGAPTASANTNAPSVPADLKGSQVSVSNAQPQRGSDVAILVKLVRNGQALPNTDVYAEAQFRTAAARIPASGTVRTDSSGAASLPVSVGDATAGYEVRVTVHAQVDGRDVEWPASFTPR